MKDMSMRVFDRLDWQPVHVKTAAVPALELPLLPRFIVATGGVSGLGFKHGSVLAATNPDPHPFWRVESEHDCSVVVAFVYVIDRAARTVVVMPPGLTQATNFLARLQSRQVDGQSNVDMAVVIAELVLCRPKDDFDPYGGTFAARCFPLGSVFLNFETDIEWTLNATRPKKSDMVMHTHMDLTQMESSFAVRSAFFSDKNDGMTYLPGGPPLPNWDNLFACYNTGGTAGVVNKSFDVVTRQPERARAQTVVRRGDASTSVAVVLRNMARQGAYDNVHIAPLMVTIAGDAVFMAPICQHDCLHMQMGFKPRTGIVSNDGSSACDFAAITFQQSAVDLR